MSEETTFELTLSQLDHLVNIGVCASKDEARPTLGAVSGEVKGDELILVATDSFRLGVVALRLEDNVEHDGSFLVNHAQLSRALKWLRCEVNASKYDIAKFDDVRFRFVIGDDGLSVTGSWDFQVPLPVFTIRTVHHKFPAWEQLFGGQPWRAQARKPFDFEGRRALDGMKMPAVSAAFLADFDKLLGNKRYRTASFGTAILSHTVTDKGQDASLKPWCLSSATEDGEVQVTYLIMPVRQY